LLCTIQHSFHPFVWIYGSSLFITIAANHEDISQAMNSLRPTAHCHCKYICVYSIYIAEGRIQVGGTNQWQLRIPPNMIYSMSQKSLNAHLRCPCKYSRNPHVYLYAYHIVSACKSILHVHQSMRVHGSASMCVRTRGRCVGTYFTNTCDCIYLKHIK